MTFRGIYNDKQGKCVFDEEGIRCLGMGGGKQKERTIRQRKYGVGYILLSPQWEDADPILIKKIIGKYSFRNSGLPQKLDSMGWKGDHTGTRREMDRTSHPVTSLCETHEAQPKGDPAVLPRHGIHPRCVVGGWYKTTGNCD